jgi:uncharacterized protein (TIGR00369 family)
MPAVLRQALPNMASMLSTSPATVALTMPCRRTPWRRPMASPNATRRLSMTDVQDVHVQLCAINKSAAFNRWCGLEVKSASAGHVELVMPWRAEFGQYSGFLHAGLIGALIDTACGFAAVTVAGSGVLAAHFSVNCLRPAQGEHFIARARVVRAGKTQVFTACELFAVAAQEEKLVATGEALLSVLQTPTAP